MKVFLSLFVTLFSVAAMSCPTINSQFQCEVDDQDPNDSGVISVNSIKHEGKFYYQWTDMDDSENPSVYPTDGKVYKLDNGGTYKGACDAKTKSFKMQITGTDSEIGKYTINMNYSLDAKKNLVGAGTAKFKYNGKDQVQKFKNVCTKI